MKKLILILPCLVTIFQPLIAKVEVPHQAFRFEMLESFMPNNSFQELEKKYSPAETLPSENGIITKKFLLKHERFSFPVYAQHLDGKIIDFYAKLPSYFSHDRFLTDLQKKWGKQQHYKKQGEEAVYVWVNNETEFIYQASCTITCFPVFLTGMKRVNKQDALFKKLQSGF